MRKEKTDEWKIRMQQWHTIVLEVLKCAFFGFAMYYYKRGYTFRIESDGECCTKKIKHNTHSISRIEYCTSKQ